MERAERVDTFGELRLLPLAARLYKNKYLRALRHSFFMIMPFWVAVAVFDIMCSFFFDPHGPVIGEQGLNLGFWLTGGLTGDSYRQNAVIETLSFFKIATGYGYGAVSLMLTMSLANKLSGIFKTNRTLTLFCACGSFIFMMPVWSRSSEFSEYFIGRNFFSATMAAFLSTWLLAFFSKQKILKPKLPRYLNPALRNFVAEVIPVMLTMLVYTGVSFSLSVVYLHFVDFLRQEAGSPVFQEPVFVLLYQAVVWFLWWVGLPGYEFTSVVGEFIYLPAQAANQTGIVENIFTDTFFRVGLVQVMALSIAILVFSRHESWRGAAKLGLPLMFFNVFEPFVFGLPVVLNPIFLIPCLLAPLANTLVGYIAVSWEIVPVFIEGTSPVMPIMLNSVMSSHSVMGGVLQAVWLVMDIFIYAPFVITANMADLSDEEKEHGDISDIDESEGGDKF